MRFHTKEILENLGILKYNTDFFKKEKVIGKGSFGSVYLVRRLEDNKIYALKTVILDKLNKAIFLEDWKNSSRTEQELIR